MLHYRTIDTQEEPVEWVNIVSLSNEDKKILNEKHDLSYEFLEYAIDLDEHARVEEDNDNMARLLSFDVPYFDTPANSYTTRPVVFIIKDTTMYTFVDDERDYSQINHLLNRSVQNGVYLSMYHMIFSILYNFSMMYHEKLRVLHKERDNIEKAFRTNADNKEIYRLMNVEKGLVYLLTSLRSNKIALNTLRRRWGYGATAFSDGEAEKIEDVLVELSQAIEVSEINMMLIEKEKSTYSTIIDNNLNATMRSLTIITALLTIPSIVFGFFGVNTRIPFQDDPFGWIYTIIIALVLVVGTAYAFWKMKLVK
ncbi:magnesium transporter CorA family protein [Carnobacteriaceae bacterium zg-ZUI252]|nr:magnesium transporter CorA family protein [Carnobacteriaceae bacterium zg-ZUI252]MBS4770501.1 magnesium transporter CorA family protein [Carnobacteriaceae bacterium zg-ZUI240]QTU82806.1 magnesium transporter CorA family protein [Carnobacteriaceae bacterium zg-C25]